MALPPLLTGGWLPRSLRRQLPHGGGKLADDSDFFAHSDGLQSFDLQVGHHLVPHTSHLFKSFGERSSFDTLFLIEGIGSDVPVFGKGLVNQSHVLSILLASRVAQDLVIEGLDGFGNMEVGEVRVEAEAWSFLLIDHLLKGGMPVFNVV